MWKYFLFSVLLILFLIITISLQSWWVLFLGLLVLGSLGYIEKILNLNWSSRAQIFLLLGFIAFSVTQIIVSQYKESELNKQIQSGKQRVIELEEELSDEKMTIKDFQCNLIVEFSGEWKEPPYYKRALSELSDHVYVVIDKKPYEDKTDDIRFFLTETYRFNTIDEQNATFRTRQAVHKGSPPFGNLIKSLLSYNRIGFGIPFGLQENLKSRKIQIQRLAIDFSINGKNFGTKIYNKLGEVPIDDKGHAIFMLEEHEILSDLIENVER